MQYVFLLASGAPNSRAAPGSPHSSYATVQKRNFTNTDSLSCFFIELNSCTSEMSCFSCSSYKDDKHVSCTFPVFEKARNLRNATGHYACSLTPTKSPNLLLAPGVIEPRDILSPVAKTVWQKISAACRTKWFSVYFYCYWWRMYPFYLSLSVPT